MNSQLRRRLTFVTAILPTIAIQSLSAQSNEPPRDVDPTALTAYAPSPAMVVLQWQPSSAAAGYRVFRRTGITGGWCMVGGANKDATSYEDATVSGSSTYLYFVQALPEERNSVAPMAIVTTPSIPGLQNGQHSSGGALEQSPPIELCGGSGHVGSTVVSGTERLPSSAVLPGWLIESENLLIESGFLTGGSTAHPVMR